MILQLLTITKNYSEKHGYKGEITYKGLYGNIQVILSHERVAQILPLVADLLVAQSRELANDLKAEVIENAAVLLEPPVPNVPVKSVNEDDEIFF